jgi:GH18 family chitinase
MQLRKINCESQVRHFHQAADQERWVGTLRGLKGHGPYLTHAEPSPAFITYDDADSTARKGVYALEMRNLGGVFMWELSGAYDGKRQDLLDSMYKTFRRIQAGRH